MEIEQIDDHLKGWLAGPEGDRQHFDGWLEFATAVTAFTQPKPGEGQASR